MRTAPPSHAYRPQAFTLAGDPNQIQEVINALQTNKKLRRRLRAQNLVVQPRPPQHPDVYQWREGGWRAVTTTAAPEPTPVGPELPEITLVHFELSDEARARGARPALSVPDFVRELRHWIREEGLTSVEACQDHTLGAPPGQGSPEHGFGSPEHGFGSPEHGFGSPEHGFGSPEHGFGSPDLVTPETNPAFRVDRQEALERIGWRRWRENGGGERGRGVTVLILDSWPVFGDGIDFDRSRADLFVDYHPPAIGAAPPPPEDEGCNFTVRARSGNFNAELAERLLPCHGPLCASLVRTIAPEARIIAVRVLDNTCNGYASIISEAIRWIMRNPTVGGEPLLTDPTRVIFNLSLGIARTQAEAVESCCLFFSIHNACLAGARFACAAGNDSIGRPENPAEPAAYGFYADSAATGERVFPVGGTDAATVYASFSNESYLAAPAVNVITDPGPSRLKRETGGANVRWRGTSFATPLVTGTLALLLGRERPPADLKQHLWARATPPKRWNGVAELNLMRALADGEA